MASEIKKRGQKIIKRFSRVSMKASAEGKEHIRENFFQRLSHIQNIRLLIVEWSLLVVALVFLAIAQGVWFGETYTEDVFVAGGTYTEGTIGQVNSMNPLFAVTNSEKVLSKLMFSTLTTIDYSGHIGMGLASSLSPSENGKVWTLRLRDGLLWSDGQPITNEDVLFTIGLIQNQATNTIFGANLAGVKVSEDGNGNIVFKLPSAYADFATALEIPIVPKHELDDADPKTLVEDEFSNTPVVSGTFELNAIQTDTGSNNVVVYLSPNKNYYLGRPLVNTFGVHTYESITELKEALKRGEVTATAELNGKDADIEDLPLYNKRESSINAGVFMFFNTNSGALKDVQLRNTLRVGINLARLREVAPDTIPLNYPLLKSQISLNNYPAIPGHDFEAAKAKITESFGENIPTFNVVTVSSGYLPEVAEALKEELENLGVGCNVTIYDESQDFVSNVVSRRYYDILLYEIELGAEPDLLPYYHSSQAGTTGLNLSNYRNILVDDLLIAARETLDAQLRVKKYESFLEYWINDVPAIGLYQANMTYLYNKNVRSYENDVRLVMPLDRFSDVMNYASVKADRNKTP